MICVRKPVAPVVLTTLGTTARVELHTEYSRTPTAYRRGTKRFEFAKSIYAHDDVKAALRQAQHDKCAFCESRITHIVYGDVEHYRPKGEVRQKITDNEQYPGYYWLAYDWSNLFLSCPLCNQRFKRTCFPLRVARHRARSHKDDLNKESPLLIDPSTKPEKDLTFAGEMAVPNKKSRKGRVTIEVLGLNRAELLERRLERRRDLLTTRDAYTQLLRCGGTHPPPDIQQTLFKLKTLLEEAITDEAEYAAMARVTLG